MVLRWHQLPILSGTLLSQMANPKIFSDCILTFSYTDFCHWEENCFCRNDIFVVQTDLVLISVQVWPKMTFLSPLCDTECHCLDKGRRCFLTLNKTKIKSFSLCFKMLWWWYKENTYQCDQGKCMAHMLYAWHMYIWCVK